MEATKLQLNQFHTRRRCEDQPDLKEMVVEGGETFPGNKWLCEDYQIWLGDTLVGELSTSTDIIGKSGGHKRLLSADLPIVRDHLINAANAHDDLVAALGGAG